MMKVPVGSVRVHLGLESERRAAPKVAHAKEMFIQPSFPRAQWCGVDVFCETPKSI
jgi:hypothetical protein